MEPDWLRLVAMASLALAGACVAGVCVDLIRRPQRMWIMNAVWPLTVLYAGPVGLWAYWRIGRKSARGGGGKDEKREWEVVATGTTHCGSGCTLGDVIGETVVAGSGLRIAGMAIWPAWIADFVVAYALGIAFQYFAIKPMGDMGAGKALGRAFKADTLSLLAWQVGMYGWMALCTFVIFGREMEKTDPVFWFMMQIGMLAGFAAAFPVNWWLIRRGIKERM